MKGKLLTSAIAALLAVSVVAPNASAATQVGNDCSAVALAPGYIMLQIAKAGGVLTVPSNGIVTKWKVNSGVATPDLLQLRVFQATGKKNEFKTVAQSAFETAVTGTNVFNARIPVQAGDRFGTYGAAPSGALYCAGVPGDILGYFTADVPVGSAQTYTEAPGLQVAVSATVEADADGDGFGDETQDGCPRSAALQSPCPVISLDARATLKKNSVVLFVTTNTETAVTVSGSVKAPKSKKASSSALLKMRSKPRTVRPGGVTPIPLKFSGKLKTALAGLSTKRFLKLKIKVAATDAVGVVSVDRTSVRLRGRGA